MTRNSLPWQSCSLRSGAPSHPSSAGPQRNAWSDIKSCWTNKKLGRVVISVLLARKVERQQRLLRKMFDDFDLVRSTHTLKAGLLVPMQWIWTRKIRRCCRKRTSYDPFGKCLC